MYFIEKFKSILPKGIDFEDIYNYAPADLWEINPRKAGVLALKRADIFDDNAYFEKYNDVKNSGCDAVEHYVFFGIDEGRCIIYKNLKIKSLDNKKRPDVSIIIPVYNNGKYIDQCIQSVQNQSLQNIEIVIINDGSTDVRVIDVLKTYAHNDNRIKLIDKSNTGYGNTMNIGIEESSGKYIGIVESDDYVVRDMYEKLFYKAKEYNLDCVKGDTYLIYGEKNNIVKKISRSCRSDKTYNKILCPEKDIECFDFSITCCGIYKSSMLKRNNIRYNETPGSSYQDLSFNFQVLCYIKNIFYIKEPLYCYRQDNELSSIHRKDMEKIGYYQYEYVYNKLKRARLLNNRNLNILRYRIYKNFIYTINRVPRNRKLDNIVFASKQLNKYKKNNEINFKFFNDRDKLNFDLICNDPRNYFEVTNPIKLCFSVNRLYIKYLWISIYSLLNVINSYSFYEINILYLKLNNYDKEKILDLNKKNVKINFIDVNSKINKNNLYTTKNFTEEAYLRVLIPELFYDSEKVIYFDCDILFKKDPKILYEIDFDESIGVVNNYCNNNMRDYVQNELFINSNEYFNSGVIVFNIKQFIKNKVKDKFLFIAGYKMKFNCVDQDIFNIVCKDDKYFLDPKWNFQWHNYIANKVNEIDYDYRDIYNNLAKEHYILHFSSQCKPWNIKPNELCTSYLDYEKVYYNKYVDNIKISVIIPVYNGERTIAKAINSVINQELKLEIIVIDDGSTDSTFSIVKDYQQRFNSVKLIKQKHQGSGPARNLGINSAIGEFIYFLDSDDYCPDNKTLKKLFDKAIENDTYVCGGSVQVENIETNENFKQFFYENELLRKYEDVQIDYGYQRFIYNTKFLKTNNLKFLNLLRYQDPVFFVQVMLKAKFFYQIPDITYIYRLDKKHVKWTRNKAIDLMNGLNIINDIAEKNNLKKLKEITLKRRNNEFKEVLNKYNLM